MWDKFLRHLHCRNIAWFVLRCSHVWESKLWEWLKTLMGRYTILHYKSSQVSLRNGPTTELISVQANLLLLPLTAAWSLGACKASKILIYFPENTEFGKCYRGNVQVFIFIFPVLRDSQNLSISCPQQWLPPGTN